MTPARTLVRLSTSAFHRASRNSTACRRVSPSRIGREVLRGRHRHTLDKDGDHAHVAREGGADLEADEIALVVQTSASASIGARQPVVADDREQHAAGTDGALEDVDEIDAGFDVRDIHEDRGGAESGAEVVEQPAGMPGTIFTPVADEDGGRDPPS